MQRNAKESAHTPEHGDARECKVDLESELELDAGADIGGDMRTVYIPLNPGFRLVLCNFQNSPACLKDRDLQIDETFLPQDKAPSMKRPANRCESAER